MAVLPCLNRFLVAAWKRLDESHGHHGPSPCCSTWSRSVCRHFAPDLADRQRRTDSRTRHGGSSYCVPLRHRAFTHEFLRPIWLHGGYTINPAGTATSAPTDAYHATLTSTVTGLAPVSKPVVRQTTATERMSGNYSGSMAGSITGGTAILQTTSPHFARATTSRLRRTAKRGPR